MSLPVCSDPAFCEEVEVLARDIAGTDANAEILELARRVAEAQIDLRRVRYARHKLLSDALSDRYYETRKTALENEIHRLPRAPECAGHIAASPGEISDFHTERATEICNNPFAESKRLLAMDRYERRALFRRKTAIQVFDGAKAKRLQRSRISILDCSPRRTKPNS